MFYPCGTDPGLSGDYKQALVVLRPVESRRLIAKAIVRLPEVQQAYKHGRLAVTGGVGNSLVLEELTGEKIPADRFSAGMSADGLLTMSLEEGRILGRFFEQGRAVDTPYPDFLKSLEKGDVILKGANAIDPLGNIGILMSNPTGGAVGAMFGPASARGILVLAPVGLEKLVPSVPEATAGWGQLTLDYVMGVRVGMACITAALVVTEIQALAILAGARSRQVAAGGVAGSEGAVVLLLEGPAKNVDEAIGFLEQLKGEPGIEVTEHQLSRRD